MRCSIALVTLSAVVASVFASPAHLERRQRGYITLCSDDLLEGECEDLGITAGECRNLPSRLQDELSSFDTFGYRCHFFTDLTCSGRMDEWTGRHTNLRDTEWNDEKSSIQCFWDA
ncbi:hypothetical protein BS50DRAFT_640411 [Corynespora cassiicola Philippines]|uniref:Beta/gamma crystallin 'Greek key' domain-containing protein n=1 Tax=Corynespora cassiicola Philippines TaxID=1448308 RepID=A0A2T2N3G0_CORCC|nr:hypothetical protein BS50DRAFT_640411 [Corynespora cassiicola Philippines]